VALSLHPAQSPPSDTDAASASGDRLGTRPNGSIAAAILAAGIGSLTLGLLSFIGDVSLAARRAFIIWNPSGPLSGVSTGTVAVWLAAWLLLFLLWRRRKVRLARINLVSFVMLGIGMLLTFPPFADLLQGK
jgi:hypothetical protein